MRRRGGFTKRDAGAYCEDLNRDARGDGREICVHRSGNAQAKRNPAIACGESLHGEWRADSAPAKRTLQRRLLDGVADVVEAVKAEGESTFDAEAEQETVQAGAVLPE